MSDLQCIVVTPEATVLDEPAHFVAIALYDGEIGIAPGHTPLIGRLGWGELRIDVGETIQRYYLEGGFIEVLGNVVSILTNRAVAADQLDVPTAEEQLQAARSRPANTPDLMAARDRSVTQARARLRVARRSAK